ncbi:hypothetical protein AGMMS50276_05300 [Synergistales bacterium]|nr:hypothetical protein AGMMS50276_05300 [Synergistales bacterium]
MLTEVASNGYQSCGNKELKNFLVFKGEFATDLKQNEILEAQRRWLYNKIIGRVPTGLNKDFLNFSSIKFDMPEISNTEKYGFTIVHA